MADKLAALEAISRTLEPDQGTMSKWFEEMSSYSEQFVNHIAAIPVYREDETAVSTLRHLGIPETGRPFSQLLQTLRCSVDEVGINPAGPGHMGYVPGGGVVPTAIGDFLAAITNRYAGIYYANPGAVQMEHLLVEWMAEMVGYPPTCIGNLSSGGSIATLTALTTARDHQGVIPENIRTQVIYATAQAHHCIFKALRIAGLEHAIIRLIPVTDEYQMDIPSLEEALQRDVLAGLTPFLIVGSAGTTDTGIIDPLDDMADLATQYSCWFHVDAAYGGFFMLLDAYRYLFKGIDRSDSVVMDPHKGLFLSYGTGAVLIKNREAAYKSHFYIANYMQDAYTDQHRYNPADYSPELTRHFRGLRMWLSLQLLGVKPIKAALEEKLLLARYFHQQVSSLGYVTGPKPVLSVCLFRWSGEDQDSNEINKELLHQIQSDGRIFLSSTNIDGIFWLRICVMVFRTHRREVDMLLQLLKHLKPK